MDNLIMGLVFVVSSFGLPPSCFENAPEVCPIPKFEFFEDKKSNGQDGRYNPEKWGENTIMLNSRLIGKFDTDVYAQSVIVHEYVHIMQYKMKAFTDLKELTPCQRTKLEVQAYRIQNAYLNKHGMGLTDLKDTLQELELSCRIWMHENHKK